MRASAAVAAFALLLGACAAPRPWGPGVRAYSFLSGGWRAVEHDEADGHGAVALELASADERGWGYELVGTYGAEDAGGPRDRDLELDEFGLGLRRTWRDEGRLVTVVGAGGVFTRVENTLHDPGAEFDDEGGAGYAHAALLLDVGPVRLERGTEALVGLDVRGLVGDDYDYAQVALVLGFGR